MKITVGSVTCNGSQFDDKVWAWLNAHDDNLFREDAEGCLAEHYDYWQAWGLFALAGCKLETFGGPENEDERCDYPPDLLDWGEGIVIRFDGTIEELLKRLDVIVGGRDEVDSS